MRAVELLNVARTLIETNPRRPREAYTRRAISSVYYAVFHCLASSCSDAFVGATHAARQTRAWQKVYRSLEHGYAKNACTGSLSAFSSDIQAFANIFVALQEQRHEADYNPHAHFTKSEALARLSQAVTAISAFEACSLPERRAFAVQVLLKARK
jgi:uncharacterized protein (UPF0332 family)